MPAPPTQPHERPAETPDPDGSPILLFDGHCNLCNGVVGFILAHERDHDLRFASLQSEVGRSLLARHGLADPDSQTMVLVRGSEAWVRSDGAVRIARHLRAPWRWAGVLGLLPRVVRDALYRAVAHNRYRVFGTRDTCAVPEPGVADRFLDRPPHAPAP